MADVEPPVLEPTPRVTPLAVMGTTGLKQSSGYVWEEYDPNLRGQRAVQTYTRMALGDPICGAILWAIESVIRGVEWEIDPALPPGGGDDAKPSKQAMQDADWLRTVLFDDCETPWPQVVAEALSCLPFGYALHENIYARRKDGRIGLADLSPRPVHTIVRWLFDDQGRASGVVQRHPVTGRDLAIPLAKCCHWRVRQWNRSPEGVSIFRNAVKSWTYAVNLTNVEAIGVERQLAGLPVARIPQDIIAGAAAGDAAHQQKLAEFVRMVRDLRLNEQAGVVLPSDPWPTPDGAAFTAARQYDFELLSASTSVAGTADVPIRRHRAEMAQAVLADFIMLGQGSVGSWALSSDKTELFLLALMAITGALEAEANSSITDALWALNGLDPATRPRLRAAAIARQDAEKLAGVVATLAGAGARMFPDTRLENHVRKVAGLPPMSDEVIEAAQAEAERAEAAFGGGGAGGGPTPDQDPFAALLGGGKAANREDAA